MVSAFRRRNGIQACLELRNGSGPPSLCADFTVTGEALAPLGLSKETSSTTEDILKRTQGLAEALGGILKIESPSPTELHLAIVLPAGDQRPGKSYAAPHETKEARHAG
jgi:hypothetical protein